MSNINNDTLQSNTEHADKPATDTNDTPALVEKFVIRLPRGLRNKIKKISEQNRRSMNSEIIMVLEKYIQQNPALTLNALSEEVQPFLSGEERKSTLTREELSKRLEALPPEKQEALLELLG